MNAQVPGRGAELVGGGRSVGFGPRWLARVWSGGVNHILDRIDAGLARGTIEVTLPDGTTRLLGGRAEGFAGSVRLNHSRALLRLATAGSVGWYQAWEAGEWESSDPVLLFALFMENSDTLGDAGRARGPWRLLARLAHWLHRNTKSGSQRNIHAHYDLGNDFYSSWLDPSMSYSSARFAGDAEDLETAQQRKIGSIAARLPGAKSLLEIGCGWGTLARHLADKGAEVTAISLSDEQLEWARAAHGDAGVDFRKQDYRDTEGEFDAIASVEMVEAVGREYWPDFFDCIARCLKAGGRAVIQFIAMRDELFEAYAKSADFIQTYIFPGGMLVRESEFRRLADERGLAWQDRESFGTDYAQTLRLWRENFDSAVEEGRLPAGFDHRFVRLWRYYLMYCEGGFRGRGIDVAQVTLVKSG
ncbi:MAG: class I SAM-dependent methyltransferase [Novosphingobium sp.]|nr:class I SAM-dependent methyltransferase [Novosphingobium sp.]MCB2077358.1 class I SAM-dependent methyltransferase [Novosphingobium sp.]